MPSIHSDFYAGVEAAAAVLAARATARPAARAAAVHAAIDRLLDDTTLAPGRSCRLGCDHCCRLPVGVSYGEALLLATALGGEPGLRAAVLAEADATAAASWADLVGRPCPLLRTGACTVHAARPLPCRALASNDAGACAAALGGGPNAAVDAEAFWRGLGAADALARDDGTGRRELRAALAAVLRAAPPDAFAAFRSARPAGADSS